MHYVTELVQKTSELQAIAAAVERRDCDLAIEGASSAGKALLVAGLVRETQRPGLLVTYNTDQARRLADDLAAFLGDRGRAASEEVVLYYPPSESVIYDGAPPDRERQGEQLAVLDRLCDSRPSAAAGPAERTPLVVVTAVNALMAQIVPQALVAETRCELSQGAEVEVDELAERLLQLGYRRANLVEAFGEFSVRGGIVDLFCATHGLPVRVELFGDQIDSIRHFDPMTQRSMMHLERLSVGPADPLILTRRLCLDALPAIRTSLTRQLGRLRESGKQMEATRLQERVQEDLQSLEIVRHAPELEHYLPLIYGTAATLLSYLPENAIVVVDEPVRLKAHADQFGQEVSKAYQVRVARGDLLRLPRTVCLGFDELVARLAAFRPVYLTMLQREIPWTPDARSFRFGTPPVDSFGGQFDLLTEGLRDWQEKGHRLVVSATHPDQTHNLLHGRGVSDLAIIDDAPSDGEEPDKRPAVTEPDPIQPGKVAITSWPLSGGFRLPAAALVVLTENEIYGWQKLRRPKERKFRAGISVTSLSELAVGDYVVHISYGIARYSGLVKQTVGGIERDYLLLEYAGEDRLYVPVTQIDRVQKYIGPESGSPTLHSLKGDRWAKQKRRVRMSARLLAKELLDLYAERERAEGFRFGVDSPWLTELETAFRYEETPDQYGAIQDVKRDMEQLRPADRLICGDVGYGKTEVAIRAAFKAVLDHKQVAVLVPTTVLAQQHWNTFRERLDPFPITVEMLSRFKTPEAQRRIVASLKDGTVDIVIGTHRLLQSDVQFKDLGVIVIDEEQRFGVRHKEKLKKLRTHVDVFTFTATPIPRTLHMALSGIREISIINDPPQGRIPIRTVAREYDEDVIREAIARELERGGQVYYVHNRVRSINHVAAKVQRLAPDARIAVGHGQLPEDQLEHVMLSFFAGDFDVLVCTTIIESGLDNPNVNTIVIEDSHRFGLSQLYQLRGRVGRSNRQAYAYLLYRYPDRLTVEAEDRLQAIQEFSELGSGFKIALRDLEIRGAGNILGGEQSGHLAAVGMDMYCKLLADAVKSLRGEDVVEDEDLPALDLPVEAVVPRSYVEDEAQRISLYRRLSNVRNEEELEALREEMRDRYGEPPEAVLNLARIVRMKLACIEVGIISAQAQHGKVYVKLSKKHALGQREQRILQAIYKKGALAVSQARAARLPRATFQARQCSFAYNPRDQEQTFRSMEELIDRLRKRDPEEMARLLRRKPRGEKPRIG